MKTTFRQVTLTAAPEAEAASVELLHKIFSVVPSVFSHPEKGLPMVSVYLDEKSIVTPAQRAAVAEGMAHIQECGLNTGDWKLKVNPLRREDWVDSWKRHLQSAPIQGNSSLTASRFMEP